MEVGKQPQGDYTVDTEQASASGTSAVFTTTIVTTVAGDEEYLYCGALAFHENVTAALEQLRAAHPDFATASISLQDSSGCPSCTCSAFQSQRTRRSFVHLGMGVSACVSVCACVCVLFVCMALTLVSHPPPFVWLQALGALGAQTRQRL